MLINLIYKSFFLCMEAVIDMRRTILMVLFTIELGYKHFQLWKLCYGFYTSKMIDFTHICKYCLISVSVILSSGISRLFFYPFF